MSLLRNLLNVLLNVYSIIAVKSDCFCVENFTRRLEMGKSGVIQFFKHKLVL